MREYFHSIFTQVPVGSFAEGCRVWPLVEGQQRGLAGHEDVLALEALGAVDVGVVLAALAAQILDVDGLEGALGLGPVRGLQLDHACEDFCVAELRAELFGQQPHLGDLYAESGQT